MLEQRKRVLTDGDVTAITDELEKRMVQRFYSDLGKGVWSLVWKGFVVGLIGIAAYGSFKGMK